MKWQKGQRKMVSLQNGKLAKWKFEKMANSLDGMLIKLHWQSDKMARWENGELTTWQVYQISSWQNGG